MLSIRLLKGVKLRVDLEKIISVVGREWIENTSCSRVDSKEHVGWELPRSYEIIFSED